jgi:hypothetical protein
MDSIFIKGCLSQIHWLSYCLRLVDRNWLKPDTEIVVMLDEDCRNVVSQWGKFRHSVFYCYCQPWPDPYMHALWCKATADYWTRGDPIMLMDCDTMLTEPAKLDEYISDGKITLPFLDWRNRGDDGGAYRLWPRVVHESTGLELDRDWMVSRPWIFWRSTFVDARRLVEEHKRLPFYAAVYSSARYDWTRYARHPFTFCDLENLGLAAAIYHPARYAPGNLATLYAAGRKDKFRDMWSHTHFTPELQAELSQLLQS